MKKANILAAFFGLIAFFGLAFGAYTTFTDLKTTGDLLVGNNATITGDLAVAGDSSVSGGLALDFVTLDSAVNVSVTTPTVVGQLVRDASFILYIATATTSTSDWIKVGTQS